MGSFFFFDDPFSLPHLARFARPPAAHAPHSRQQYYDIDSGKKHYFYYMAASRSNPATDPVVLWREWALSLRCGRASRCKTPPTSCT